MLLLVTIALVVVAFVLLIIGFIDHSLALIYTSIVCSVGAAAILIIVSRVTRRRALRLSPVGASPAFGDLFADVVPGTASSGDEDFSTRDGAAAPEDEAPVELVPGDPAGSGLLAEMAVSADDADTYIFPIEAYDELRVNEIIPLLVELDPDELEDVRAWELEGRARVSIVRRIDVLLRAAGIEPPPSPSTPPAPPVAADRLPTAPVALTRAEASAPPATAPAAFPATEAAARPTTEPAALSGAEPLAVAGAPVQPPAELSAPATGGESFPISGYDKLRAVDILPLLEGLNREQLQAVAEREMAGAARSTVLNRVRRLLR